MLLPIVPPEQSVDDQGVTYIVDRGLIRFGKFAGATLALFLIVGAYFFGFKLDDAVEKVRDVQENLSTAQRELATAQTELRHFHRRTFAEDVARHRSHRHRTIDDARVQQPLESLHAIGLPNGRLYE